MNRVYCDMDGVLVDFVGGVVPKVNEALRTPPEGLFELAQEVIAELGRNYVSAADLEKYTPTGSKKASEFMYRVVEDDVEFWANLEWNPEGKALWEGIKEKGVTILTSPMDKRGAQGSLEGKLIWLENNLGLDNIKGVVFEHEKFRYATTGGGNNVLFDDFMSKIGPWREEGGKGFHFQNNAKEALAFLEEANV